MKKLVFGIVLVFAIGLSLSLNLQNEGTDLSKTNLSNLMTTAQAQDEGCCPGVYDADEVYYWDGCKCEYDAFDCCMC